MPVSVHTQTVATAIAAIAALPPKSAMAVRAFAANCGSAAMLTSDMKGDVRRPSSLCSMPTRSGNVVEQPRQFLEHQAMHPVCASLPATLPGGESAIFDLGQESHDNPSSTFLRLPAPLRNGPIFRSGFPRGRN